MLLVSATAGEIKPFTDHFSLVPGHNKVLDKELFVLITGVGMVATAYSLGKTLSENRFDLAVNAGIAGSFNRNIALGEVVLVKEDCFAELGFEDDKAFITIDALGFGTGKTAPIHPSGNFNFRKVNGITVNKVHGSDNSIENTLKLWNPDIETMEGAAFFYACNQENLPSVQIRAISNYVEKRNRESWNIGLAVKNLNHPLINLITDLL